MNKTVRQSSTHRTGIHPLSSLTLFSDVRVISLTLEARVFFETGVKSEKMPTLMFTTDCFLVS